MGAVGKGSVSFFLLLFFCTHVSTHACSDEKEVVLFQTAGAGEFSFISIAQLLLAIFLVPSRSGLLGLSWY